MSIPDPDHPAQRSAAGGSGSGSGGSSSGPGLRDSKGWDGKLRVAKTGAGFDLAPDDDDSEPGADSDRDEEALEGETIDADEGERMYSHGARGRGRWRG